MRGIISCSGYVPYRRLDRAEIREFTGSGGGRGTRSVASFDEDTTTMGVAAARLALAAAPEAAPSAVWFATAEPAYLEKTNATAIHAALRLDHDVAAFDFGGAVRSGAGALLAALRSPGTALVVTAGLRGGLVGGADEAAGGDGAAALVVGEEGTAPVLAELLGSASSTEEFVDRWRTPGDARTKQWEERFGETKYVPLGERAWNDALKAAELSAGDVDVAIVTGPHARSASRVASRLGSVRVADDLSSTVGHTGAAHGALLLASVLEAAEPGQVIALVHLADGADVALFRTTDAVRAHRPARSVATQVASGGSVGYAKYLQWRGMLPVQPPNRPEPARPSASAAGRNEEWKFGFVGSRARESGVVHLPPARVSIRDEDPIGAMDPAPMADVLGTVVTYTIDRLAYSVSPPVVFAVVDFDGGGRLPMELTDVDADAVRIGDRVEMTFRRLHTADGIHNYFWKARPVRDGSGS